MDKKAVPLKEFLKGFEPKLPSGTYTITTENGVAVVREFKPLSKRQVQ